MAKVYRNKSKESIMGECPETKAMDIDNISLSEGSGGLEMQNLISNMQGFFPKATQWTNIGDDSASVRYKGGKVVFTTDSYVVTPIFFPGGDIGKIAFCGTVNDLAVMGAKPIGISLGLVLEEGFPKDDLFKITRTIGNLSKKTGIPIVTGDTKVVEKDSVDKIIINTSGIGFTKEVLDKRIEDGDHIIISGGVGEHAAALLARRFDIETAVKTCSKPIWDEMNVIKGLVKQAKDITRGGLAAILNEMSEKNRKNLTINEEAIPIKTEVKAINEILGLDPYSLACEGRFICIVSPRKSSKVVRKLKIYNKLACVIGVICKGRGVIVKTRFGNKILNSPSGEIVPRIC